MPSKEPEDSRIVSVRLPNTLVQRLDRLLDWQTTHRRRPTTRNAAMREALARLARPARAARRAPGPAGPPAAVPGHLRQPAPSPDGVPIHRLRRLLRWPRERFDAVLEALRAAQPLTWRPSGAGRRRPSHPRQLPRPWPMLWPPPLARVSGDLVPPSSALGARLGAQRSPLGGTLATIAPLTFHSMDDGLSHAACGSVSLAQVRLGVSRAHPAPARGVPGACREASPVLPHPDADDPQLPFLDPTQYRYELIRPLLLSSRSHRDAAGAGNRHPSGNGGPPQTPL